MLHWLWFLLVIFGLLCLPWFFQLTWSSEYYLEMSCKCFKYSKYLPSLGVALHIECSLCGEVFCTLNSGCDRYVDLSHNQFQHLLESIRD